MIMVDLQDLEKLESIAFCVASAYLLCARCSNQEGYQSTRHWSLDHRPNVLMGSNKQYYAVREGREPGVYQTWPEAKAQVIVC